MTQSGPQAPGGDDVTALPTRAYPAYTTPAAVRIELPPRIRLNDVSDEQIQYAIDTQANRIDGALLRYYDLPAPPLLPPGVPPPAGQPGYLPAELERINRYYAVAEVLVGLLDLRQDTDDPTDWWTKEADKALKALQDGEQFLAYPFKHPSGRPYFVSLAPGSPLYGRHPLSAHSRMRYSYPRRRYSDDDGADGVLR